jgi:N-acetyl-gamma-glutamyl-phosphate reductase
MLLALPHGSGQSGVRALAGCQIVDFSATSPGHGQRYAKWYGHAHELPAMLPIPYGIPELNRAAIAQARLVADPGRYPPR